MTSWNINDGTNNFDIYEPNIVRQLSGLNYAEMSVICNETTKPIMGASATLTYGATTVFIGYVNELKKINVGEYTLKLVEIANDLTLYYVHTGTAPSENRVVIIDNNPGAPYTLGDYIDTILNDTGWTDASDSIYRDITLNPVTSAIFDDTMFNNMTVYDALVQMIETTCGYYVWFDNALKQVHYGPKDTLVTGRTNHGDLSAYIIDTYTEDSNVNHNVDRVIVVSTVNTSDGAEYEGGYPTTGLPTYPKTLIYQYEDVVSDDQAATIAQQIYNERNSIRERLELKLLPDLLSINEGDIVSYDSVSYSVIDVTITDSDVTVGLKYFKESIFDILGDKITLVSGGAFSGVESSWSGGWKEIGPNNDAIYTFDISNISSITDFILNADTDYYKQYSDIDTGLDTESVVSNVIDESPDTIEYIANVNTIASANQDTLAPNVTSYAITSFDTYTNRIYTASVPPYMSYVIFTGASAAGLVNGYPYLVYDTTSSSFVVLETPQTTIPVDIIGNPAGASFYVYSYDSPSRMEQTLSSPYLSSGYEFGLGVASAKIESSVSSKLYGYIMVYMSYYPYDISLEWIQIYSAYFSVGANGSTDLTVPILIPSLIGYENANTMAFKAVILNTNHTAGLSFTSTQISYLQARQRHNHTMSGTSHMHGKSDGTLQDTLALSHEHSQISDLTSTTSLPSNMRVYIDSGGGWQPVGGIAYASDMDITSYLGSGTNKIRFTSSTLGNVNAYGSYMNYG